MATEVGCIGVVVDAKGGAVAFYERLGFLHLDVLEGQSEARPGPATMFRRVLLPLSLPGILAGTILTFILGMNAYATPVLLGGPKFKMMGPLVYGQFQLNNWPFGASVAFVLMTATLGLTATANILVQRRFRR